MQSARRALTISGKLSRTEIAEGVSLADFVPPPRPRTRGDCLGGPRPCPWVSCAHHVYLDVLDSGALHLNFPDVDAGDLPVSCVLDVADRGGATLEVVGETLNLTRERIRQIEMDALNKLGLEGGISQVKQDVKDVGAA